MGVGGLANLGVQGQWSKGCGNVRLWGWGSRVFGGLAFHVGIRVSGCVGLGCGRRVHNGREVSKKIGKI